MGMGRKCSKADMCECCARARPKQKYYHKQYVVIQFSTSYPFATCATSGDRQASHTKEEGVLEIKVCLATKTSYETG